MKMEQIECSETSAYKIQTPGKYPEENIQHFYFVEEGPGRGSEDVRKNVTSNVSIFFFFSVFFMDVMCGKIAINLIELH
jgi:hypothetical protein